MSYEINSFPDYLCVTYSEHVDDEIMFACFADIGKHMPANRCVLIDCEALQENKVSTSGIQILSKLANEKAVSDPPIPRIAYYVPKDVEYGMGRMFMAYLKEDENTMLFRDRDEALAWLRAAKDSPA